MLERLSIDSERFKSFHVLGHTEFNDIFGMVSSNIARGSTTVLWHGLPACCTVLFHMSSPELRITTGCKATGASVLSDTSDAHVVRCIDHIESFQRVFHGPQCLETVLGQQDTGADLKIGSLSNIEPLQLSKLTHVLLSEIGERIEAFGPVRVPCPGDLKKSYAFLS